MRDGDIRFSRKAATLEHHSARGKVIRNSTNFTRGSQLFSHEMMMTWAGIKVPLMTWLILSVVLLFAIASFHFHEHQFQLVCMKIYADLWGWIGLDPDKAVNLTLPDGSVKHGKVLWVPYHPAVVAAWNAALRILFAAALGSVFICIPMTIWFVEYSRKRGKDILRERHERGALLITKTELENEIIAHNQAEFGKECASKDPPVSPSDVLRKSMRERVAEGFHAPYRLAGIPYPWRLEQSHAMFIGTTGAGKTTELKKIVTQARARGHRCVIFDLTGSFVENFYNPETDVLLNTMDRRCQAWTIFSDCDNYSEFLSASNALIPSGHNAEDDFWQKAARTLFVEMCMKLIAKGATSNGALAYHLMQADLKKISRELENTVAAPLVATQAAKMAESIRATFNTHANALRFLPDPVHGEEPFSINKWMIQDEEEGSILFITSNHNDLVLNRPLLTLWMDLAVNALFRLPRTRDLRTWFLLDEVHSLHKLPAIDHGLQTARAFGGAFVLGIHSFDKLAETYGEKGAINLASLARTKLVLTTSDLETAKRCADFIGSREVRQMDEAYSYGANNTRDASTITPRKEVQHLVMPDDIKELPSLHGFVKFPDGFPAAKIQLTYKSYPEIAAGFERVTVMRASTYKPSQPDDDELEEGGRETDGRDNAPIAIADLADKERQQENSEAAPLSKAEIEAAKMAQTWDDKGNAQKPDTQPRDTESAPSAKPQASFEYMNKKPGEEDSSRDEELDERGQTQPDEKAAAHTTKTPDARAARESQRDNQESLITREEREGIGTEHAEREHDAGDDFEQEM